MMSRRTWLAIAVASAAGGRRAVAQTPPRTARVGVLSGGNPRTAPQWVAFEERLRELGHIDGQAFRLEFRDGMGHPERIAVLAKELAALGPDVVVAAGPEATLKAVKQAAPGTPIVMIAIDYDPVALGHVAGLAHPAGNVTGVFFRNLELTAKRLELLAELVPRLGSVAVLWDEFSADQLRAAETAAQRLHVRLQPAKLANPPYDLDAAFRAVLPERPGALLGLASPLLFRERRRLADLALRHRLPAIGTVKEYAGAGLLMSYGVSFRQMFRRGADYVGRILAGARPANVPVEQPATFELVLNLKTAAALGIAVPPALRLRADEVIA